MGVTRRWGRGRRVLLFANTDWYLFNFRRSLAEALRQAGFEVVLVSPPGPYGDLLKAMGFRWLPAPMERRSLNPVAELKLLRWLTRLMRVESISLVHGFTIKCAVYGTLAARWAGVKATVLALTGMGYVFTSQEMKARLLRPLVRSLLSSVLGRRGSRLILQNHDDLAMLQEAGLLKAAQVSVIPGSGVDCDRFFPIEREPASGEYRVLLVARLLWDKGLAEYVEAARILMGQGRAIRFLLAGTPDPGNPASVDEVTVRQWVSEGLVEWLGHVDNMPGLLNEADLVVLPSYREGLPKSLIEAAACGLPLVTTDVPGCREVVTHEVDGLLVPVRDAGALAAAVGRMQDDPALAGRMGAAALAKARSSFDDKIIIGETLAVYRTLLEL